MTVLLYSLIMNKRSKIGVPVSVFNKALQYSNLCTFYKTTSNYVWYHSSKNVMRWDYDTTFKSMTKLAFKQSHRNSFHQSLRAIPGPAYSLLIGILSTKTALFSNEKPFHISKCFNTTSLVSYDMEFPFGSYGDST